MGVQTGTRVKLWSYSDLMALRIIYWLRQRKTNAAGAEIPASTMRATRRALRRLRELDEPLWQLGDASIWVDADGEIHVRGPGGLETLVGQIVVPDAINLVAPFTTREGLRGPDLAKPRPDLRIAPGRLSVAPLSIHTRLETRALFALSRDGLDAAAIGALYPYVPAGQLAQALSAALDGA